MTDAKLLTGVLDPAYFAGGQITLDVERARRAMQKIADGLDVSVRGGGDRGHPGDRRQHDQRAEAGLDPARLRSARLRAGGGGRRRGDACGAARPRARRQGDGDPALSRLFLGVGHAGDRAAGGLRAHLAEPRRRHDDRAGARNLRRARAAGAGLFQGRGPGRGFDHLRPPDRPPLPRSGAHRHGIPRSRPHGHRCDPGRLPYRARARLPPSSSTIRRSSS